jgi:arsenite methyltransferase
MTALQYDKEATERLLAMYVTPDVAAQRNEFLRAFGPWPAERVLDVGSGPGFLATAIAEAVGSSGRVCGIDISEPLLLLRRSLIVLTNPGWSFVTVMPPNCRSRITPSMRSSRRRS